MMKTKKCSTLHLDGKIKGKQNQRLQRKILYLAVRRRRSKSGKMAWHFIRWKVRKERSGTG